VLEPSAREDDAPVESLTAGDHTLHDTVPYTNASARVAVRTSTLRRSSPASSAPTSA